MKDIETIAESSLFDAFERAASRRAAPNLAVDVERYQVFLNDPALSNAQKTELTAFWSIVCSFVDLGFGVH